MIACLFLLLGLANPAGQDPGWQELRFHRVHLLNGNFIDGQLIRETPTEVHLQVKAGQMAVRRDLIGRVEFIKMRHITEKVQEVVIPVANSDPIGPRTGPPRITPRKTRGSAASAFVGAEVKEKAEALFERLRRATNDERKAEVARELRDLGEGVSVYAADVLDSLDDASVKIIGPMLVEFKSPDVIKIIQSKVQHSRAIIRAHAAAILGACAESAEDVRSLLPLAADANPEVAYAALTAMTAHSLGDAFPAAVRLAASKDAALRQGALAAMGQLAKSAQREADLEPALKDLVDSSTGEALIDVLTQVGSSRAAGLSDRTAALLTSDDAAIRAKAAQVVGDLGDRDRGDAVLGRLDVEDDKWTRIFLAQAALKLRVMKSVDPLIQWMGDEDGDIRLAALETLKKLTGVNAGLTKESWEDWKSKKQ